MSFRNFTDAAGRDWQVFDVVPILNERRGHDRRAEVDGDGDEERRDGDRRVTVGGTPGLGGGAAGGWLCFEQAGEGQSEAKGEERRRLSPIPEGWTQLSDVELNALCQSAQPVKAMLLDKKNAAVNPQR